MSRSQSSRCSSLKRTPSLVPPDALMPPASPEAGAIVNASLSGFCANLAFTAIEQAADIGAMHDPGENGQDKNSAAAFGRSNAISSMGVSALATKAASEE